MRGDFSSVWAEWFIRSQIETQLDFAHEQNGEKNSGGCAAAPGMDGALGWRQLEDLGKNFTTSHYLSVITECLLICPEEHGNSASLLPSATLELFIK